MSATAELRGSRAVAIGLLADMLARSETFREYTGTDANDVRTRIHFRDVTGDRMPKPFGIVFAGNAHGYGLVAGGGRHHHRPRGNVHLYLAAEIPEEFRDDKFQSAAWFDTFVGCVLDEVVELSAAEHDDAAVGTTYLPLADGIEEVANGETAPEWPGGRFHYAIYLLPWGAA